jgi:hypothetical protein
MHGVRLEDAAKLIGKMASSLIGSKELKLIVGSD